MISVSGIRSGKLGDEDLLRAVAHPGGIVDDQRLRVDALEDVGRRDVVHVEGRILAQQHDVHLREVGAHGSPSEKWSPLTSRTSSGLDAGEDLAVGERQAVGRVVEERVAAPLRLQRQREAGVAGNGDGLMWSIWMATLSDMDISQARQ